MRSLSVEQILGSTLLGISHLLETVGLPWFLMF